MIRLVSWVVLVCALLLLVVPVVAQDDDDDGAVLNADMQWRLADKMWQDRLYDDFAAFALAYAEKNPDHHATLEAWWRIYIVYREYRRNDDRKKDVYPKAIAACERWQKKYATTEKKRAALGLWYHALLMDREGGRPQGIQLLTDLITKYPDQAWGDPYWYLGEWLREAKRYPEAIKAYEKLREMEGISDRSANCIHRIGICYQEMGDRTSAIDTWRVLLEEKKFNWGWGGVHWNAIDIAERLQRMGEEQLARHFALKLLDHFPNNDSLTPRAKAILNEKPDKRIELHAQFQRYFSASTMNLLHNTKVNVEQRYGLQFRMKFVTKDNPFAGDVTVTPKIEMDVLPKNMTQSPDKKSFTTAIAVPNAEGRIVNDWDYWFIKKATDTPPGGLTITRSFEKTGNTWGYCTVRIQTPDRWNVYIYMPNDKGNVNNLVGTQPNDLRDGNRTYCWWQWANDMSRGWEVKFPVEVGANVKEYLPKIFLERGVGTPYRGQSGNSPEMTFDTNEFTLKVKSEQNIPYIVHLGGYEGVTMQEISR